MLIAGAQLHRTFPAREYHQGHLAVQGVNTVLPFLLENEPISDEAVWLFLTGRITINGRDFSVDVPNKTITWLSTSPFGVAVSDWMEISYFSKD